MLGCLFMCVFVAFGLSSDFSLRVCLLGSTCFSLWEVLICNFDISRVFCLLCFVSIIVVNKSVLHVIKGFCVLFYLVDR